MWTSMYRNSPTEHDTSDLSHLLGGPQSPPRTRPLSRVRYLSYLLPALERGLRHSQVGRELGDCPVILPAALLVASSKFTHFRTESTNNTSRQWLQSSPPFGGRIFFVTFFTLFEMRPQRMHLRRGSLWILTVASCRLEGCLCYGGRAAASKLLSFRSSGRAGYASAAVAAS